LTTAIIGVGNVGGALARHLAGGGEPVVLAARDESATAALAGELGSLASANSVPEAMLPAGAHYVKALGTLAAGSLASSANRAPRRGVLFYATDDDLAGAAAERLITVCGFDPVKVGGVSEAGRLEMPGGDLHQGGGLGGKLLDADQARAAVAAA